MSKKNIFNKVLNRISSNKLTVVFIDFVNLNELSDGLNAASNAISSNTSLIELSINIDNVDDASVQNFANALASHVNLKSLKIWSKTLTDSQMLIISSAIQSSNITDLGIYGLEISDVSMSHISNAIPQMKNVELWDTSITNAAAINMSSAIKNNPGSLVSLQLGKNHISDDSAIKIAEAIETLDSFEDINLYDNEVSDDGVKRMGRAFKNNPKIKKFNISKNDFSDNAMEDFSEDLKDSGIEEMSFQANPALTNTGANFIINAAHSMNNIHSINIDIEERDEDYEEETTNDKLIDLISSKETMSEMIENYYDKSTFQEKVNKIKAKKEIRKLLKNNKELKDLKKSDPEKFQLSIKEMLEKPDQIDETKILETVKNRFKKIVKNDNDLKNMNKSDAQKMKSTVKKITKSLKQENEQIVKEKKFFNFEEDNTQTEVIIGQNDDLFDQDIVI